MDAVNEHLDDIEKRVSKVERRLDGIEKRRPHSEPLGMPPAVVYEEDREPPEESM